MKRLVGLVLTAAALTVAFGLPEPDPQPGPDFVGPEVGDSVAPAAASVWYCPWVASGALRDSTAMLAATVPVNAELTLPQQIVGEDPDIGNITLAEPGASAVAIGEIVRRGDTPLFVEFDDGPAAAAAVVMSNELITGDTCVSRIPKVWELPGGTTREGRTMTLRLFNPFPELAKVTVDGASESGETGLVDLQNIDVEGRTWQDVSLNALLPLLDELSLTVTSSEGFVIPALAIAGTTDEASWPGVAAGAYWEFPVATPSELYAASMMLTNSGSAPVTALIDVFTASGATPDAREVEVAPGIPSRVDLSDLADGALGIRVRASGAVAAAVVAEESTAVLVPSDEEGEIDGPEGELGDRIAGTIGISAPARQWLLPGLQAVPETGTTAWILNTGDAAATVTLQPLGVRELAASKQVVPAGAVLGIPLEPDLAVGGFSVESSAPVSIAWSAESETGLMFVTGTVVGD